MRVLLIDNENMLLDMAMRCAAEGHEVRLAPDPRGKSRYGEGMKEFTIVADWRPHMEWAKSGLILLAGNYKYCMELDRYKDFGFRIFAPSAASARLELDRYYGMQTMEAAGIDLLPYEIFDTMEAAEKFARKSDKVFVFKVLDGAADDKALTYVSHDQADLSGWLRRQIKGGAKVSKCMLQEKIDADFEIGVNGWFGPDGFIPERYQLSFEAKPLMSGDIGPNTGEQVSVSQYVAADKLVDEMLVPMAPILKALGHVGDFCVGAMIDKKGKAWPLEMTARLGYPAFFGQTASHKGDPAKWMRDLLDGKDSLRVSRDVCMAAVLAQPPYPYKYNEPEMVEGNPIRIDADMDDLHLCHVMRGKGPVMQDGKVIDAETYQTTGAYVMVATALGRTIEACKKRLYRTIDGVKFPGVMYRNDAGDKVVKALPAMKKAGYALELE